MRRRRAARIALDRGEAQAQALIPLHQVGPCARTLRLPAAPARAEARHAAQVDQLRHACADQKVHPVCLALLAVSDPQAVITEHLARGRAPASVTWRLILP
jgi:hypothetical protein